MKTSFVALLVAFLSARAVMAVIPIGGVCFSRAGPIEDVYVSSLRLEGVLERLSYGIAQESLERQLSLLLTPRACEQSKPVLYNHCASVLPNESMLCAAIASSS
ncbi:hypothetical protein NMY22_g18947 [Coprinellus aureogranulatus]|nr:hypothetical protein NMY22_g18947 [Coprinellus aureogranulatus]